MQIVYWYQYMEVFNIVLVIRKQSPVHFIFMLKKSITNIDCKSNYFWVRDSYFLWVLQKQRLFKIFRNKISELFSINLLRAEREQE